MHFSIPTLIKISLMELPVSYFLKRPRYWLGLIVMSFAWLIGQLPTAVHLFLAKELGWLLLRLGKSRRKIAEINLALCFKDMTEQQRSALLKQNFYQVVRSENL